MDNYADDVVYVGRNHQYGDFTGTRRCAALYVGDVVRSCSECRFGPDPDLWSGPGLRGAAIASVIARLLMLYLVMMPVIRLYRGFAKPEVSLVSRDFRAVSKIAGPAAMTNVATPVGAAIVMREMSKYGTETIAGMAIVGRLTPIAFASVY